PAAIRETMSEDHTDGLRYRRQWSADIPVLSPSSVPGPGSCSELFGDPVGRDALLVQQRLIQMIMHEISVFPAIEIMFADHFGRSEPGDAEEQLRGQVGLSDIERDPVSPLAGELADQFGDHLSTDSPA